MCGGFTGLSAAIPDLSQSEAPSPILAWDSPPSEDMWPFRAIATSIICLRIRGRRFESWRAHVY